MNTQPTRIPSLDGLRAISIGLVLISHMIGTRGLFIPSQVGNIFALGELGVRVFFVISGFLITNILVKEVELTGRINLWKFYLRRTLRIFPPYYVFLAVLIALVALGYLQLDFLDKLHALTYTANYHPARSW